MTRPIQEMSDTAAAIRAAKEVQADTLSAELFRSANEWFFKAKHEYKFKDFRQAKALAFKARRYAELAEFEAIRNGGNRNESGGDDPLANSTSSNSAGGNANRAPTQSDAPGATGKSQGSSPSPNAPSGEPSPSGPSK